LREQEFRFYKPGNCAKSRPKKYEDNINVKVREIPCPVLGLSFIGVENSYFDTAL
jgi:hypothetical protein